MRNSARAIGTAIFLLLSCSAFPAAANPVSLDKVTAKAVILIDAATGDVIWQRNSDLALPPASTTKVLTALVALRSGRPRDSLTVSANAAQAQPSKIYLRRGWRLRLDDLLSAVLLSSANDAAEVVAEGVAGSVDAFATRMNRHARLLGAVNSHFVNPHGLPADDHVSTARDLAIIFQEALREPRFREIVSTKTTVIHPTQGSKRRIRLWNHNRLLNNFKVQVVGKTGWTRAAKKCFDGAALEGQHSELIVAVLGSRDLWGDLKKLLDYGLASDRGPALPAQVAQADDAPTEDPAEVAAGDSNEDEPSVAEEVYASRAKVFALQLATFSSSSRAERLRATAESKGYKAIVSRIGYAQSSMHRVTIPGFKTRGQAQAAAAALRTVHRDLRPIVTIVNG